MPNTTTGGETYVLITNVRSVTLRGVRCYASAIVLQRAELLPRDGLRCRVRGFGTDPSLPHFDIDVPSIEYEICGAASAAVMVGVDGQPRPLSSGAILRLQHGPELQIVAEDDALPIEVERFADVSAAWARLLDRAAYYWVGTNMPTAAWVPAPRGRGGNRRREMARATAEIPRRG